MPGLSLEGLVQAGAAELAELRRELGAFRGAVEGQLEQALRRVQPLARALRTLEEEHLELRAELACLGRRLDLLTLRLGPQEPPGEDLSTLFLEAQDPCAHFEGTEEPSGPVAHPPAFSSTRQQSTLHLSRSNSSVSAGSPAPRQCLVVGWGGREGGTSPQGSRWPPEGAWSQGEAPGMRWDHGCSARAMQRHWDLPPFGLAVVGGTNGACLLRIAGMPAAGSCPAPPPDAAVAGCRWWHGCTWLASPPPGGFAVGRLPGQGSRMPAGARCVAELLRPDAGASCLLLPCPILGLAHCLPRIAGGSC